MKVKRLISLPLLLLLLSCAYNSSLVKTAYDTLSVSQVSYDTSMKIVSDLNAQGKIPLADLAKIREAATIYSISHNTAVDALSAYESSKDSANLERLEIQLSSATSLPPRPCPTF